MFTLCLGKNGGYFQIGGYNQDKHMEEIMWTKLSRKEKDNYIFPLIDV